MEYPRIFREVVEEGGRVYGGFLLELENALLALLYEGEEAKLGTLAIAISSVGGRLSSFLLGGQNIMGARVMAERLSQKRAR